MKATSIGVRTPVSSSARKTGLSDAMLCCSDGTRAGSMGAFVNTYIANGDFRFTRLR